MSSSPGKLMMMTTSREDKNGVRKSPPPPTTRMRREEDRLSRKKSSLEELLFYKGQPSLFYQAQLQKPDYELQVLNFPSKLVKSFSMAQMLCGILLIIFGMVAILTNASLAYLGGGLWSGALISVTGFIGILTAKNPKNSIRIIAFLIFSLLGVAGCALIIVLSATAVAGDINSPETYYVDNEGIPVSFLGRFKNLVPAAIAANSSLLVLAIISCLLSLGSCVLSAKEACQCYGGSFYNSAKGGPAATTRRDRLLSWLGQQAILNTLPPIGRCSLMNQSPFGKGNEIVSPFPWTKTNPDSDSGSTLRVLSPASGAYNNVEAFPLSIDKDIKLIPDKDSILVVQKVRKDDEKEEEEEKERIRIEKSNDNYTEVDRKMAEDYIERLLVIDEKRLSEMYRVILKDGIEREN